MGKQGGIRVAVLCGDPELPYSYGVDGRFPPEDIEAVDRVMETLETLEGFQPLRYDNHARYIDDLRNDPPDIALNFCDTGYRNLLSNELNLPGFLEMLEIPYTGAGPVCMSFCSDKALVRLLAAAQGIPVPNEKFVDLTAEPLALPDLYPAMIKPNAGCGSIGISSDSVVHDPAEADAYLRRLARELDRPQALVQDFLTGPEYTVGILGNPDTGLEFLPVLEIDYSRLDPELPPILSYGSKADPDSAYWNALQFRQAELDEEIHAAMVRDCTWLFERLGFRDYARIDFRAGSDGVPRLLDANFNPTWNPDGKLAIMANWAGYGYGELLRRILEAAMQRQGVGS